MGKPPVDRVAAYDSLREAPTQLMGAYVRRITTGGREDPAIQEMRDIHAQVRSVDTRDVEAQEAATRAFREELSRLRDADEQNVRRM